MFTEIFCEGPLVRLIPRVLFHRQCTLRVMMLMRMIDEVVNDGVGDDGHDGNDGDC